MPGGFSNSCTGEKKANFIEVVVDSHRMSRRLHADFGYQATSWGVVRAEIELSSYRD